MLIGPGATAYLLTDSFERMLLIAALGGGFGAVFKAEQAEQAAAQQAGQ